MIQRHGRQRSLRRLRAGEHRACEGSNPDPGLRPAAFHPVTVADVVAGLQRTSRDFDPTPGHLLRGPRRRPRRTDRVSRTFRTAMCPHHARVWHSLAWFCRRASQRVCAVKAGHCARYRAGARLTTIDDLDALIPPQIRFSAGVPRREAIPMHRDDFASKRVAPHPGHHKPALGHGRWRRCGEVLLKVSVLHKVGVLPEMDVLLKVNVLLKVDVLFVRTDL